MFLSKSDPPNSAVKASREIETRSMSLCYTINQQSSKRFQESAINEKAQHALVEWW